MSSVGSSSISWWAGVDGLGGWTDPAGTGTCFPGNQSERPRGAYPPWDEAAAACGQLPPPASSPAARTCNYLFFSQAFFVCQSKALFSSEK